MFYVFLAGIPLVAAAGLYSFGRLVDFANGGRPTVLARLQAIAAALAVAGLVLAAAVSSPLT